MRRAKAMRTVDNLDAPAKLVLGLGAGVALYLIAVPLAMLLIAAFRGPADYLPFEPGARWTFEHIRALFTDPARHIRFRRRHGGGRIRDRVGARVAGGAYRSSRA